jgi:hypothetical protein
VKALADLWTEGAFGLKSFAGVRSGHSRPNWCRCRQGRRGMHRAVAPGPGYSAAIAMPGSRQGAARSPPPRRAAPSCPAAKARCPTHRWTHDRCRRRSPSRRMVRAYAAIGRRRHGPLCCRRANGALRFILTIDYGPFSASHDFRFALELGHYSMQSARLKRAKKECVV